MLVSKPLNVPKKRRFPGAIRNKELAELICKASGDEYYQYEVQDFLELFCSTIEDLVKDGVAIELYDFGIFRPKVNPSREMYSALKGENVVTKESTTLEFTASITLQNRVKSKKRKNNETRLESI